MHGVLDTFTMLSLAASAVLFLIGLPSPGGGCLVLALALQALEDKI